MMRPQFNSIHAVSKHTPTPVRVYCGVYDDEEEKAKCDTVCCDELIDRDTVRATLLRYAVVMVCAITMA